MGRVDAIAGTLPSNYCDDSLHALAHSRRTQGDESVLGSARHFVGNIT